MYPPTSNQVRDNVMLIQTYRTARGSVTANNGVMVEIKLPWENE